MRLQLEAKSNGKIKVQVERDDGKKTDFEGEREDFTLDFKPVEGKEDDDIVLVLYGRFRTKHPKDDGTPIVKDKAK